MPTPALIDRLEPRICFAAGPTVTNEMFVGPRDGATALVITFSGPLDAATAQDPDNYNLVGSGRRGDRTFTPPFNAPVYNDADRTVTLAFKNPLAITRFDRIKVVLKAKAVGGIADPAGNLLDGDRDGEAGENAETRFKVKTGTRLKYRDADGDRIVLKLKGAKRRDMTSFIAPSGNVVQVWTDGKNNTLEGKLKATRKSNGATLVGRVVLGDASNASALATPFSVGQTVFDGQAPIDPLLVTGG